MLINREYVEAIADLIHPCT